MTHVARVQGFVNDFDVAHDSLGEAKKIVKAIMSISASDYLVKQELAVLRVRIKLERGQLRECGVFYQLFLESPSFQQLWY